MYTRARYVEVAEALEKQILSMGSNSLLPTEQQLAKRFDVSRVTVRRALSLLQGKGLLSRQRGRGTIVNPPKITRQILPVCPIEQDLRAQGLKLETRVLEWTQAMIPPEQIRARLGLKDREKVCFLSLIRIVDDRILCHDDRYIPGPLSLIFNPERIADRPIHYVLQDLSGLAIKSAACEVEITPASNEVAKLLGLVPGVPIFVNRFTNYFENGDPAESGVMSYRIDLVKFKFAASETSMKMEWPPP